MTITDMVKHILVSLMFILMQIKHLTHLINLIYFINILEFLNILLLMEVLTQFQNLKQCIVSGIIKSGRCGVSPQNGVWRRHD